MIFMASTKMYFSSTENTKMTTWMTVQYYSEGGSGAAVSTARLCGAGAMQRGPWRRGAGVGRGAGEEARAWTERLSCRVTVMTTTVYIALSAETT